jgi:hypothetical protein
MELNNKLIIGLYLAINTVIVFVYIAYTLFTMGMSEAYFSSNYPAWHHYFLWLLIPFIPVYIYIGCKNILNKKTIVWLSTIIPLIWISIMFLIVFFIRLIK